MNVPIHRWSYWTPNDQLGVKPYSNPTPRVPPQRVALCRNQTSPSDRVQYREAIVGYSRAALDIEKRHVPGPTDLAGEEADAVSFHVVESAGLNHADATSVEIAQSPWASNPNTS